MKDDYTTNSYYLAYTFQGDQVFRAFCLFLSSISLSPTVLVCSVPTPQPREEE